MFTEDAEEVNLTHEEQQQALLIAVRAVDVKFTSAQHMQKWFEREAGGNVVLAMFAAFLWSDARKQAEQILLDALFNSELMEVFDAE